MVVGGVDIKTAQTRLGHASPITTLRVYAQATPQADREAAKTVARCSGRRRRPPGARRDRLTQEVCGMNAA